MGGNALKEYGVGRKSATDYHKLTDKVLAMVKPLAIKLAVVPAYSEKESFGDMDILIAPKPEISDISKSLKSIFNPKGYIHNGECHSLDYDNLQIDFLITNEKLFDIGLHYYSYNDLNNLIGRTAHKQGLKYGHKGLVLPVKYKNTYHAGDITISTNPKEIYAFLGYDYERYKKGFKNLPEIFEYVTTSPYFDANAFELDQLNAANRVRNRKRPTFNLFLDYLHNPKQGHLKSFAYNEDKTEYINRAFDYFAHNKVKEQYQVIQANMAKKEECKAKFNGSKITELYPKLAGSQLGDFIAGFKKQWKEHNDFEAWVLATKPEQIEEKLYEYAALRQNDINTKNPDIYEPIRKPNTSSVDLS